MINHVMVGTNDLDAAKAFYDAVLPTVGYGASMQDKDRLFWPSKNGSFAVTKPIDGEPSTVSNGFTLGFKCDSAEQVTAFHDAAVAAGGTSIEDPPGLREGSMGAMHLSYVRDLDGHKLCAIHRG